MRQIIAVLLACGLLSAQVVVVPVHKRPVATGGGGTKSATFASESHDNPSDSSNTLATPGSLPISTGDVIACVIGWGAGSGSATGACGGNTLTSVRVNNNSYVSYSVQSFYGIAASAGTTGCTFSLPASANWRAIGCANWHVANGTASLTQSSCGTDGYTACNDSIAESTSRTNANVTTTVATSLLVSLGLNWNGVTTFTQTSPYTLRFSGATPYLLDTWVTTTGTYPSGNVGTVSPADAYMPMFMVFGVQ